MNSKPIAPRWEHFDHEADIGIRGIAPTLDQAFEQAAVALTSVVTDPDQVSASIVINIQCEALDIELLLVTWINKLVYEMAVHGLLFNCYKVIINDGRLSATAFGEAVNR